MKKTVLALIISLGIMGILVGCGKKNDVDDSNDTITPTPEVGSENGDDIVGDKTEIFIPIENPVIKEEYDYNDYIKLGKYKGIEVKINNPEVPEEDIDTIIQMDLMYNDIEAINVTDRAVSRGDTVNIDFVGYHNGEPFDGGSAEGYDLIIGSGMFIQGFEDQIIGAEIGNEIEVNVTFPENYTTATLAGEPVIFKVKINSIKYYELTEDYLKDKSYESAEAYRESIREGVMASYADNAIMQKEEDVYAAVVENAQITLPDNLVEYYASDIRTYFTNAAMSNGTTLENYIALSGSSIEEFEMYVQIDSNNRATRDLIIRAISAAEGIEVTEEEFQAEVDLYVQQYNFESEEEFLKAINVDMLKDELLYYKIIDFLVAESIEI